MATVVRPDLDVRCAVAWWHPSGLPTQFRMRAWFDERLVVVCATPNNRGASVTNAIEHVAAVVEVHLDMRLVEEDPADWSGWQLVERCYRTGRLDLVRFTAREDDLPVLPQWVPLERDPFGWLYAAVG